MIHDPAGCGLSWLPFWVCNFLSKFYKWFFELVMKSYFSACRCMNVSAGHQEMSMEGEIVPFSCWISVWKGQLRPLHFAFYWSAPPYKNHLFSALLSWKISHGDVFCCLLLVVQESSPSGSLLSIRVFNWVCSSVCIAYLLLPLCFCSCSASDFHSCSGALAWCS